VSIEGTGFTARMLLARIFGEATQFGRRAAEYRFPGGFVLESLEDLGRDGVLFFLGKRSDFAERIFEQGGHTTESSRPPKSFTTERRGNRKSRFLRLRPRGPQPEGRNDKGAPSVGNRDPRASFVEVELV